jgi:signal transduction histidine kinase
MVQALLMSSGAASLVAVVVSLLLSRRIVSPIQRLLDASRRIAAGHYSERVPAMGNDELAALASQFNTMAAALESAEQRRVALIGDVAHELRTPLATIEGYAEGAIDGVVATNETTWALILDEVGRLRRLVTDLQELSRAEARQLPLHPTLVPTAALVERARARLAPQFDEKGVTLRLDMPASTPAILVDPDRITQVLINLLGNALQHTSSGGSVTIRVVAEKQAVRFHIEDTGIGIAAEHLPHLFERFYRVDKARARTTGGSGIGLTISKALVEAHGGQIWADSAGIGQGAVFSFILPIQQS